MKSASHELNIEIKGLYIDFLEKFEKKEGITQVELARRTNIGQAELSRIESGKINPTLETIAKLAAGIGYKPAISLHKITREQGRGGGC